MFIWAGVLYASGDANSNRVAQAKTIMTNTTVGIIAFGLMYLALNWLIQEGFSTNEARIFGFSSGDGRYSFLLCGCTSAAYAADASCDAYVFAMPAWYNGMMTKGV